MFTAFIEVFINDCNYSNACLTTWNTLPNIVVKSESLNVFKNRLDKLWENQELLMDYRSVLDKKSYTNIM